MFLPQAQLTARSLAMALFFAAPMAWAAEFSVEVGGVHGLRFSPASLTIQVGVAPSPGMEFVLHRAPSGALAEHAPVANAHRDGKFPVPLLRLSLRRGELRAHSQVRSSL